MKILHGEHIVHSRAELGEILDGARQNAMQVIRLSAPKVGRAELELALQAESLFGEDKIVVVEELHSLPTSTRKKELIEYLASQSTQPGCPEIVLWEKRALTATMLKKFPASKATEYKTSSSMFTWLDSLNGSLQQPAKLLSLFHQAVEQDGEHFCFLMLIRQARLLIQVKNNHQLKVAPFMLSKLQKQAKSFSQQQLLTLYDKLISIELRHKTSQQAVSLVADLDLLQMKL